MVTSFQGPFLAAAHPSNPRLLGAGLTALVHAVLILGWHMTRTLPPAQPEGAYPVTQWLHLPVPAPRSESEPPFAQNAVRQPVRATPAHAARTPPGAALPSPVPATVSAPAAPKPAAAPPLPETPPTSRAQAILEDARRSVGGIDRALRKESRPTIVAPPDSPQIRMRQGMEQAHAIARPRLWEAPKITELVNNTGDGARRTRVITGSGIYCITERSPATSIDMIERHGKTMLTSCPSPEEPAKRQEWRTARD